MNHSCSQITDDAQSDNNVNTCDCLLTKLTYSHVNRNGTNTGKSTTSAQPIYEAILAAVSPRPTSCRPISINVLNILAFNSWDVYVSITSSTGNILQVWRAAPF